MGSWVTEWPPTRPSPDVGRSNVARNRIVVLRQEPAGTRQIPFPYSRLASKSTAGATGATGQENFCLQPGDIILVP